MKSELDNIFRENDEESKEEPIDEDTGRINPKEYNYLLQMPLWSLTFEKIKELNEERD